MCLRLWSSLLVARFNLKRVGPLLEEDLESACLKEQIHSPFLFLFFVCGEAFKITQSSFCVSETSKGLNVDVRNVSEQLKL